jgi:nitroimidazol reductase NimA-like FMN-containing flavoprotein (pyridoxamine 5'-phosphate oxidase superfamily)
MDNAHDRGTHVAHEGADEPSREIENLGTAQCWHLLEAGAMGRLAVQGAEGVPDVFPVNYTVHSGSIYLRTAPGSKLMKITERPGVAFEVDGQDGVSHWSVVIKGSARRLDSDEEIHESGVEKLVTASPTSKNDFVAITVGSITGRRFRKRGSAATVMHRPSPPSDTSTGAHEPVRPAETHSDWPGRDADGEGGPIPIPHFPPPTGR